MNRATLAVLAVAALLGGCGPAQAPAAGPAVPTTATTATTAAARTPVTARAGMPTVPDHEPPAPQFTTATTVLQTGRPAVVVTFPDSVLFAFGSAELRPEAEAALQAAVDLLRQHPGTPAEIAGHTDSVGSAEFNQALSEQRAGAVVAWLVAHGVPRTELRPAGYGATRPVAGNDTEDGRRRNRRVELTVAT